MVTEAVTGGVPFGWVAATRCTAAAKLRAACEDAGKGYVLAVPVSFQVPPPAAVRRVSPPGQAVPARCWETRQRRGCKGHRD